MYQEAAKKTKRHANYIVLYVYFFSEIAYPFKKKKSLGMGFDRLPVCNWCGAKWVNWDMLVTKTGGWCAPCVCGLIISGEVEILYLCLFVQDSVLSLCLMLHPESPTRTSPTGIVTWCESVRTFPSCCVATKLTSRTGKSRLKLLSFTGKRICR